MTDFKRRFDADALGKHVGEQNSLIGALFDRWVLPGGKANDEFPLRLAIRNGYLNFYVHGQSVAELSTPRRQPRLKVHWKYAAGVVKGTKAATPPPADAYRTYQGDDLMGDARNIVAGWIMTAATYAMPEKRFVEHLVANNHNVIDLEMALPGDNQLVSCMEKRRGKLVAPRMDIVVAHAKDDGETQIDFWEAKLANNAELRATLPENGGITEPHVCQQLTDYTAWVRLPHRTLQVQSAFQEAGQSLDLLAERAGKHGAARDLWRALGRMKPQINPQPGIVVGNYDPLCPKDTRLPAAKTLEPHLNRLTGGSDDQRRFVVRQICSRACANRLLKTPLPGECL
ncbi:hypothetical protein GVO57_14255 (plasmid) [Sphingomonas changnyeongensis]|uniref:Uncharacterized protein n=1 Tax=Sphingomonas changnyeongensis TaxID=2698679 RepID=A0A7Z2NZC5_9SPHN|nr:hypothetical protein [Sphingomonas changnyeongensis]QHL92044.1 hypothetical protein GVO57_14255 [Sphingomonas changnyeongensis]